MKKYTYSSFIFLVLLSMSIKSIYAQDPVFSQPYANPLYLNPAFAGTGNSQRFGLNYQFPNRDENPTTYNASYDRNFIDSNNGIGLLVNMVNSAFTDGMTFSNNALTTTNISLIYAHQFHIKSFTLSAGAQITYLNLSLNESKLGFSKYVGWVEGPGPVLLRNSITAPDYSGGILGYGKNYFFGFSADHFSQTDESFYQGASPLQIKYAANIGFMFPVKSVIISPTFLYQKQGTIYQSTIEWYVSTRHLTAGLGYRSQDAIIGMLGYQGKLLRVGYSYDYSTSKRTLETGGIQEASLALLLPYSKPQRKKVNGLNYPAF
jgi:type IX secretion system PorP/SprF family membrane protein